MEEIPVPKTKEEAKKLFKKYKNGKLGHDPSTENRSDVITRKHVVLLTIVVL